MPHKDPAERKAYHKAYSAKWNAEHAEQVRESRRKSMKAWRTANPSRARDHQLKKIYGLERGGYEALFAKQGGKCAICAGRPSAGKSLHVDHDHATGDIRGLLCSSCNTGIGLFRDNAELLLMAADYLSELAGAEVDAA